MSRNLPGVWGSCPDHCNCAVYLDSGQWVGCQRARMTGGCKPHHKDRVCRNAAASVPAGIRDMFNKKGQFKVSCCGASCGQPGVRIGHALDCRFQNGKWTGHLRTCRYAGEDLRCSKK